jgi:GntR family transcriptional regulator, arabinose operon transcriptional repressor
MKTLIKKSPVPVYAQLSKVLRGQLTAGVLKSGDPLPSENELSKKFSVSRMTARAALLELEKEGLVDSIQGKGRFVKEESGAVPPEEKRSSVFTVAVYPVFKVSPATAFYFTGLLNGLNQGFHHHHVRSKFFREEDLQSPMSSFSSFFSHHGADGILWGSPLTNELPEIRKLEKEGLPVVMVNESDHGSGLDYVTCNHGKGALQLTEHLIQVGHRNIGCLAVSRDMDYAAQRWQGYLEAHGRNGLSADPRLTVDIMKLGTQEYIDDEVQEKLTALRKAGIWPTAWFIASGALVPGMIKFLKKENLSYPRDVSLVVFDEVALPPELPRLTCIRQPLEKIGETAVDILVKKLRGRKNRPVEITMDPVFIVGNSCLPCK